MWLLEERSCATRLLADRATQSGSDAHVNIVTSGCHKHRGRTPGSAALHIVSAAGAAGCLPVMERNLRRALDAAKTAAKIDGGEKRLSWHALRHSAGSIWLTAYGLAITTVSAMMGHSNPAFTLACYGRDPRDEQAIVADVLERARAANGG